MENNFECKDGIYLEPRLQEYIKKKIYYKKNRINPGVPLEHEFSISQEDIRRLKAFKSGDNDIYNHKKQEQFYDKYEEPKFEFDPDEVYKSDIRYHRFAKKLKRDKEAMKQRHNYDDLDNDYQNAFNPITDFWNDEENSRFINMPQTESQRVNLLDGRDFDLEINSKTQREALNTKYRCNNPVQSDRIYKVPERSQYRNYESKLRTSRHDNLPKYRSQNLDKPSAEDLTIPQYTPRIDFRNRMYPMQNNRPQQLPIDHNPRLNEIIGQLDTYGNKINRTYQHTSEMDTDLKVVIPNVTSNGKKCLNSSSYRPVPYVGRAEGIRNIDTECEMRDSLTTRGAKSFGYLNPVEHYYDYISSDIQDPDHVVFNPGISTRLDNHKVARPYKREILN